MEAFAIRAPSIDDLLDPYSAEPVEQRPLREDVRDRILRAWIDTREQRPSHLTVELPAEHKREGLGPPVEAAIRNDLVATYAASRRLHVFTRAERREAQVAFTFLIVCLVASSLIDTATSNDASSAASPRAWSCSGGSPCGNPRSRCSRQSPGC